MDVFREGPTADFDVDSRLTSSLSSNVDWKGNLTCWKSSLRARLLLPLLKLLLSLSTLFDPYFQFRNRLPFVACAKSYLSGQ